ncbi:carbohydrate ABC transporter permease [Thermomonospora curvata]|uniref:Binding-protein-dependent transport systems inner membrane component n=1 Tax=Thermomonospora curvata (strain ATCC 19995 / DSM 43183 / JCM 3096 / KCTC 9072 / NBRC 15933 / NCIMB 10081 / Henssen B9) TaxID=471852 RepID=D1AC43_THECD|nr:sugar ABC transporter permease [Thermomonospora curvata]ACY97309.1 binding-protein-dependent transport systems inner membrane component [Thermomonospora curvata DSM 43183]
MGLDVRPKPTRRRAKAETKPSTDPPPRRGLRARLSRLDIKVSPYLLISPFYVVFAVFGVFPLLFTLWMSLRDRELASGKDEYVGLRNYADLLGDADFLNAVVNTVAMFFIATVPQLLLALLLANALNRRLRASTLFRVGALAPLITSTVAVAVVFTQLFDTDYGLVNWLLGLVGIDPIAWQSDRWWSWVAISAMVDWRWTGYNALIYLAAMQAIPRDLYEAAAIDGASRRQQFWQITVPMLRPTILFTVIVSTIGGLQLFTEPVLFDNGRMDGGSTHQFQTVAMYMYDSAFYSDDYGYGAAVAWMIFLLIIAFSLLNFMFIRRMGGVK